MRNLPLFSHAAARRGAGGHLARRKASGVLSDLEVNTVVLDDGAAELAFLSVDVCVIEDAVVEELLSRIHDASGIPKHCIFITATHTHSAPTLGSGLFDAAEPDVLYIALAKRSSFRRWSGRRARNIRSP